MARFAPFHCTVEAATNPLPVTVSVNAPDPATVEAGEICAVAGAGLLMLNVAAVDVPPPGAGFTTVTAAVPALVRSEAVIATVSCVALI